MLGIAGFPASQSSDFFSRLMECQRLGADLRMLDVFHSGERVVIPHRYQAVMSNPAWGPLHEYHRHPEWDAFASVPIKVRQSTIGVLNAFVTPGKEIDEEGLEFLTAMAEQAGLAIDYASSWSRRDPQPSAKSGSASPETFTILWSSRCSPWGC
ncbi:GAF domain-containing protein [Nesterenkonia pannonica]|uniref:GAF domain-containing protein n=1 Tax=Nesterenkonia pannonica TaxID=1548602 RepID=UPI002164CC44|nr:GAF domain-containing protein [Nesterenkonia pannonica]